MWVFSLAIPHGMHLVVPTHHSIFWVVCHPSRTFSPKKFKQEPQNRLSLLPIARPYPLLSLTHDPPLQYWLGTSWWCLGLVRSLLPCMSKACLLLMRLPWTGGSCAFFHSFLTSYGVNCFMILHSLSLASSKGLALLDCVLFSLLAHYLLLSLACQYSCHAIMLFLLWRYLIHACWASFEPTVYSSLNWLQCPSMAIEFILMLLSAFLIHYITCGLIWPISLSLGNLGPFSNSAFPWAFTNSFGLL